MDKLPSPSLPPENKPETNANQPAPVMAPIPAPATVPMAAPAHHRNMGKVFLIIGLIVGIIAALGIGAAMWYGLAPNPFAKRPTAESIKQALMNVDSAQLSIHVVNKIENRAADVEPLDFSIFAPEKDKDDEDGSPDPLATNSALSSVLKMLPSDLASDITIRSTFQTNKEDADIDANIAGSYTANNVNANIDISFKYVDGKTYIRPDKVPLPIPIIDLNAISGKWIATDGTDNDPNQVLEYIVDNNEGKGDDEEAAKKAQAQKEMQVYFQEAINNGALAFSEAERVTLESNRVWKITLVIDGEKLRDTYLAIAEKSEQFFGADAELAVFAEDNVEVLKKERAKDVFRELAARTQTTLYVEDDGMPVQIDMSTRIAPKISGSKLKDKQITTAISIGFSEVNQPITVEAPNETITTEEATGLILGLTEDQITSNKQEDVIDDIRDALKAYNEANGTYPESLEKLVHFKNDEFEVMNIPVDQFTGQPYGYKLIDIAGQYELTYTMKKEEDESAFASNDFVDGINTATPFSASKEADELIDWDEDGLSKAREAALGTSDYNEDTDGDGFSDKAEVDAGYDPITNAQTGEKTVSSMDFF